MTLFSGRRRVLQASLLTTLTLPFGRAAAADDTPPDIGVSCEPPILQAMRSVAVPFSSRTGTQVVVLGAPASSIVSQVERETRTDVLALPSDAMDEAAGKGLIQPDTRRALGHNPLVFAARRGFGPAPADATALLGQLGAGWLAATEPTPAATFDGTAALDRLGLLHALDGRLIGAANSGDVAFLLRTGMARFGLLPLSVVRADGDLVVALPTDPGHLPPTRIDVALVRTAKNARAHAFLDFLVTPNAASLLQAGGVEGLA